VIPSTGASRSRVAGATFFGGALQVLDVNGGTVLKTWFVQSVEWDVIVYRDASVVSSRDVAIRFTSAPKSLPPGPVR
jgi:hypothetical protein